MLIYQDKVRYILFILDVLFNNDLFVFLAAKALTKKNRLNLEENEESEKENEGNINDENNDDATDKSPKQRQKAKKRRQVSTITKNPETLNARLDTFPLVDPFFAKLNSMVGDINSSKRLMQNIIPTIDSNLKLRQNVKFWDLKETVNIDLNEQQDYHKSRDESDIVTVTSVSGSIANTVIRNDLKDYRICEMPLETEEDADKSAHANDDFQELFNASTVGRNASHFELQFDINAAVEPIPTERSFVMDFGDMDDNDFEDLNDEAMAAVNKCKGLKRQPVVIEDMQPETAVHLEYSYRPLDNIDQFWAGPSHWKFRQSRRHCSSVGTRASQATAVNSNTSVPPVRKVARKKKIIAKSEVLLEDLMDFDEDNDVIISITRKANRQQVSTQTITKRWDSKKLRLPIDFKLVNDIFDRFIHASTIQISSNPDATFTGNDDGMPYDYDNENDRNYCSRIAESQSDTETETNTDIGQMDNNDNVDFGNIEMPPPPVPADEIPDIYVGAPERIEKISIAYAKRAKIIDMKQLKICSWNLISTKNTSDPFHNPCFSETLKDLPKVLNKTMAENMSMPLAFYAMLHLCNDKSLILKSNENLRDFEICFPK